MCLFAPCWIGVSSRVGPGRGGLVKNGRDRVEPGDDGTPPFTRPMVYTSWSEREPGLPMPSRSVKTVPSARVAATPTATRTARQGGSFIFARAAKVFPGWRRQRPARIGSGKSAGYSRLRPGTRTPQSTTCARRGASGG